MIHIGLIFKYLGLIMLFFFKMLITLKLTFSHLKMDGWNTILSLWGKRPIFQVLLLMEEILHHLGYKKY